MAVWDTAVHLQCETDRRLLSDLALNLKHRKENNVRLKLFHDLRFRNKEKLSVPLEGSAL